MVRAATRADFPAICALNLTEVQQTSPLDEDRLSLLDALSCYHKVAARDGVVVAFLLAMPSDAAYQNVNFQWFIARYPRFVYIDRIVVSASARGQRVGVLLYEDLFDFARRNEFPLITCEYNLSPPN